MGLLQKKGSEGCPGDQAGSGKKALGLKAGM